MNRVLPLLARVAGLRGEAVAVVVPSLSSHPAPRRRSAGCAAFARSIGRSLRRQDCRKQAGRQTEEGLAPASRGARTSALHDALRARGCVHQARHGFERPGFFSRDDGAAAAPKPYDYYGAYAEGGWRLAPDHADVAAHAEHR